jgi:hypothetical protein
MNLHIDLYWSKISILTWYLLHTHKRKMVVVVTNGYSAESSNTVKA